ncbi:hypothetical protein D3C86_2039120 [compost metagenome]
MKIRPVLTGKASNFARRCGAVERWSMTWFGRRKRAVWSLPSSSTTRSNVYGKRKRRASISDSTISMIHTHGRRVPFVSAICVFISMMTLSAKPPCWASMPAN